jgi:hypothetical protein
MRSRLVFCVAVTATAFVTLRADAQSPRRTSAAKAAPVVVSDTADEQDEAHEVPPRIATGVTAGAIRFAGGRTDNALGFTVLLRPLPWMKLSAAPGYGRSSLGRTTASGFTDVPLSVGVLHDFGDVRWSPSVSTSLGTTLSPGDTAAGFALGRSSYSATAGLGMSPTERLSFWSSLEHPLSANSGNGSVELESSYGFGRATMSTGLSSELGTADSGAVLSRSLAAGVAYKLRGPLTLTVDGSHGITTGAPSWTMSVGLGTAYAGISQLSPTSPFKRLRGSLGGKTSALSGYSSSKGACRRAGTC